MALIAMGGASAQDCSSNCETIQLFNGKNLDGWYTYLKDRGKNVDPNGVFTVVDGMLRISGEEWGAITTNEEFENYKITIRYKWGKETHEPRKGKARDSGFLFHSVGEDGAKSGSWMYSVEANIYEGRTGELILIGEKDREFSITSTIAPGSENHYNVNYLYDGEPITLNGVGDLQCSYFNPHWRNVAGTRSPGDVENLCGEWNVMECIIFGGEVYVLLNGQLVNHATDLNPRRGKIQFQSEGAEIFYKEISIKKI